MTANRGAFIVHKDGLSQDERDAIGDSGPVAHAPTGDGPRDMKHAKDTAVRTPRSMSDYRPVVDAPEVVHPLHMCRWVVPYTDAFKDGSGPLTDKARDEELAAGRAARRTLEAARTAVATYGRLPRTEDQAAYVARLEAKLPLALGEALVLLTVRVYCGTYGSRKRESVKSSMRKHMNVLACTCKAAADLWRQRSGDGLGGKYLGTEVLWRRGLSPSRLTGLGAHPMHFTEVRVSCDFCGYEWFATRTGRKKTYLCRACSRNGKNGAMFETHTFTPFGVLSEAIKDILVKDNIELHRLPGKRPAVALAQPPGWACTPNTKNTFTFTYSGAGTGPLLGQRNDNGAAPNITPSSTSRLVRVFEFNARNAASSRTVNQKFRMVKLIAGAGQIKHSNEFSVPGSFRVGGTFVRQLDSASTPGPLMHLIAGEMQTVVRSTHARTNDRGHARKVDNAERHLERWRNVLVIRHKHMQLLRASGAEPVLDYKVVFEFDPVFDGVRAVQFERTDEALRVGRRVATIRHDSVQNDIAPMNAHYYPMAYPVIFQTSESAYDTNGTTRAPSCEPTGKVTRHQ